MKQIENTKTIENKTNPKAIGYNELER